MDEKLKRLIEEFGTAINDSVTESEQIAEVIAKIKAGGYDVFLVLNATIVIKNRKEEPVSLAAQTNGRTEESRFNRQDMKFLKSLHISANE